MTRSSLATALLPAIQTILGISQPTCLLHKARRWHTRITTIRHRWTKPSFAVSQAGTCGSCHDAPLTVSHKLLHDGRNRFISGNGYTGRLSPQPSMSHSQKATTAPSPARPSMGRSRKQPRRQATQRIQAHTASAYGYAAVPSAKPNTGRDRKWLSPQEQTGMPVRSTTPCDTTVHTTQRRPGHNLCRGAFLIFSPSFLPRMPAPPCATRGINHLVSTAQLLC